MQFSNEEFLFLFMAFATGMLHKVVGNIEEDSLIDVSHLAVYFPMHFKDCDNVELVIVILVVQINDITLQEKKT